MIRCWLVNCEFARKIMLTGRADIDPGLLAPLSHGLNIFRPCHREVLTVGVCDPEPGLEKYRGIREICNPNRWGWLCQYSVVVLGRIQQNPCRVVDVVGVFDL